MSDVVASSLVPLFHSSASSCTFFPVRWESVQFSSITQSCPSPCDPMDCRMPGLPVHHRLPELAQTHVHRVGDAIQPSHPLLSPFLPHSIFPNIRVLSNDSVLHIRWLKYWSFSFSIIPSNEYSDWFPFGLWDENNTSYVPKSIKSGLNTKILLNT